MAHLSLSLLGAFQVTLDGAPVTRFGSIKTQALLAYLATEADRPHRRDALAGLLWPEQPDGRARNNLRHALSMLRRAVGDRGGGDADAPSEPALLVMRDSAQFNCDGDCWVDVHAFETLIHECERADSPVGQPFEGLTGALDLYRGDFLEGFHVSESAAFDDWTILVRDRLQRQAATALRRLIRAHTALGQTREAITYAWHWVALEPWQESAHQRLMEALARGGRRTEALAQFEDCRRMLDEEYGVEPSAKTLRLWEQISEGRLVPEIDRPATALSTPVVDLPGFVAREPELAALHRHVARAVAGDGHVVLVAGEAGQGKTMLVRQAARLAMRSTPGLLVADGKCGAYAGAGDPYRPFREILGLLAGDVEGRLAARSIARGRAERLRSALPLTAQALVRHGPDMIGVFISGPALLRRAEIRPGSEGSWLGDLRETVARNQDARQDGVRQEDLFDQVTRVLTAVARRNPLMLIIDDLQWADPGSIGLLFHLGRQLAGSRVLVVCAYRSEEVAAGRKGERHPVAPLISEFRRTWGDIVVDLRDAQSASLVTALIDGEPNALDDNFRETLLRQTSGHALFTVELLRGMKERGDLVRDPRGRWVVGPELNWQVLPARVEAVVGERIGRLPPSLRAIPQAAAVEGESFTAEAIAQVRDLSVPETVTTLSRELDRMHHLVRAEGVQQVGSRRLSRYRFRHILFQTYLYHSLDPVERVHLHESVGRALENLHGESDETLGAAASQLAWQFRHASIVDKAARYYEMAGQRAIRMLAYPEAVAHLTRGIEQIEKLPASAERDGRELGLRLAVAMPIFAMKSWGAEELLEHYSRAEALAERLGDVPRQLLLLSLARSFHNVRAEHRLAIELAERYFTLATQYESPVYVMLRFLEVSCCLMFLGDLAPSLAYAEELLSLYDPVEHAGVRFWAGQDPKVAVLVFAVYDQWYLGYPDRALAMAQQAAELALALDHPVSVALGVGFLGRVHRWRGEVSAVQAVAQQQGAAAVKYGMPLSAVGQMLDHGWVLSEQGQPGEGIALWTQGLAAWEGVGMGNHLSEFYCVLAEMCGKADQPDEGLKWIAKALALVERTDERYHEAELYRLRGELELQLDPQDVDRALADFRRAVAIAQQQSARSLELRAAMSLCRLWRNRSEAEALAEAQTHLAEVYDWFTEGFETRDLLEARALVAPTKIR